MAAQPIGPRSTASSAQWFAGSPVFDNSYLLAAVRAALIAVVLLAVLAVIVLF
ncbi:hypothetical protein [Mycobacterium sp.]|uniref:hypothetical protein n=1 Tax=Mycobacterium sp. TaxID=1785 RepID=UPI0025D022CF|nr:hypothetical protein [Mycobacterium sp.]